MPISAEDIKDKLLSSGKITIATQPYGTIELRGLALKCVEWLNDKKVKTLPAREFVAHLVQMHLLSPVFDIETVQQWQDDFLSFIATTWWREQKLSENFPSELLPFEALRNVVYDYYENWYKDFVFPTIDGINTYISKSISPVLDGMQQLTDSYAAMFHGIFNQQVAIFTNLFDTTVKDIINQISQSITAIHKIDTSHIFAALPDFTEFKEVFEEIQQGEETLREAGYAFAYNNASIRFIRQFATVDPGELQALITNKFVRETQEKDFQEELHALFKRSSVLYNRWEIIEQALGAHCRQEYYISIPAFLSQIEGIIGDWLILKKLVYPKNNKLFKQDTNGNPLIYNGKQVEAKGLGELIKHYNRHNPDPELQNFADFISSQLVKDRNGILHGKRTDYGKATLSVQALLVIKISAETLVDFENGHS